LEGISVCEGHFPAVSVLVDLPGGWRAGVDLMLCPEDFDFDYVVVPPFSEEHKIIGVHGGNHWLPALRWEEVQALAGAIRPATAMSKARGVLLFYPGCIPGVDRREEVVDVLRRYWSDFGFPVRHLEEWIQRTCQCEANIPWKQDPIHGWLCESESSLRNAKWIGRHHRWTPGMLEAVAKLFFALDGQRAAEPGAAADGGGI
jgi:hypothetical protein